MFIYLFLSGNMLIDQKIGLKEFDQQELKLKVNNLYIIA